MNELAKPEKIDFDNITVIVRSVGELTEKLCIRRLQMQFGEDKVFLVKNVCPFSEAVKSAYSIGVNEKRKWTLLTDADIFLYSDRMRLFLNKAESVDDDNWFCMVGQFYDKFFFSTRVGGVHLYKTELLEKAIELCDNNSLRPETSVKRKMAEKGYNTLVSEVNVGIHDFFQRYEDIKRKGVLHSKKHDGMGTVEEEWKRRMKTDPDYFWILEGIKIGNNLDSSSVRVDKNWMDEWIKKIGVCIPEKRDVTEEEVERVLEDYYYEFATHPIIVKNQPRHVVLKNALLQYRLFQEIKRVKDCMHGR